jgi:hypothetical protein
MTPHLAKEIPYRSTSIAYGVTKTHIEEMLKEAGAVALRWTETPDSMKGLALPVLEFILTTQWEGVEKQFGIRIQPPLLYDRRREARRGIVNAPNRNASMRLLYWYLKARLEAVKFGLEDVFDAFMSRVINSLPDGQTSTIGETARKYPAIVKEILPTFEIKSPSALEEQGVTATTNETTQDV